MGFGRIMICVTNIQVETEELHPHTKKLLERLTACCMSSEECIGSRILNNEQQDKWIEFKVLAKKPLRILWTR